MADIDTIIDTIYSDIMDRSCILIIGTDLVIRDNDTKGFYEDFVDYLKAEMQNKPQDRQDTGLDEEGFYDEDGFFNITDKVYGRPKIIRELQSFCTRNASEAAKFYCKIAQIPFQLIFFVSPDLSLLRTLKDLEVNPAFYSYNPAVNTEQWELADFDYDTAPPLLISLLTQYDDKKDKINDAVLTYDDFIAFISNFYKNPLPANILSTINNAKQIVFLGHRFDKWYDKIICDLFHFPTPLLADNRLVRKRNMAILKKDATKEKPEGFYTRQYKTKFEHLGIEEFVDALYEKFSSENKLRQTITTSTTVSDPKSIARRILQLCKQADLEGALKKSEDLENLNTVDISIKKVIYSISSRFSDLNKKYTTSGNRSRGMESGAAKGIPTEERMKLINEMVDLMYNILE